MKATGIVRRIDDLGRVVIPKEIRRNCRIREGDPLEIYTSEIDGYPVICFAKYQPSFLTDLTAIADKVDDELYVHGSDKRYEIRDKFNELAQLLKEAELLED